MENDLNSWWHLAILLVNAYIAPLARPIKHHLDLEAFQRHVKVLKRAWI